MQIPILIKHNQDKPIGVLYTKKEGLFFKFNKDERITRGEFFSTFGCGFRVIDMLVEDDKFYVMEGQIMEFSMYGFHNPLQEW